MKEEDKIKYDNLNLQKEVKDNDFVFFDDPPAKHARDTIEEPEGIDTPKYDRPEDPELQGKPPGAVSLTLIETVDLISEGPIEGIASGSYLYTSTEGAIGYDKVQIDPFVPTVPGGFQPHASGYLRAIYYNDMELISKDGRFNFQNIDTAFTRGEPVGKNITLVSLNGISSDARSQVSKSIKEKLRGPEIKYTGTQYLPSEIGIRPGHDILGRDSAKFYKVTNKTVSSIKVGVRVGSLYYRKTDGKSTYEEGKTQPKVGKGDIKGTTVKYRIDYRPYFSEESKNKDFFPRVNGVIQQNTQNEIQETIYGKVAQGYVRETTINIDRNKFRQVLEDPSFIGWEIAVYRETFDSVIGTMANSTQVDTITEIFDEKYCFPNTSYIRSRFSADTFQQVPKRTFLIRGLKIKVPNNYNPLLHAYGATRGGRSSRSDSDGKFGGDPLLDGGYDEEGASIGATTTTWDGDWKRKLDGTIKREWTNNPAWIFYDLATNPRYGLGKYVDSNQLDKWTLYKISQYCDEMVPNGKKNPDGSDGAEPRLVCNTSITNQEEASKVLQNLASTFRGLIYYMGGLIGATHDAPQSPTYTFTNANVVNGDFVYSSSSKRARHTVALVRFNDENDNYAPAIEYVEDAESIKKYGIRVSDVTAFGTTSKTQAQRFGRYILGTERFETQNLQFTAGIEASYLRPGDVIEISDSSTSTYKELSARRRGGRTSLAIEIFSGASGHSPNVNWTGMVFLDSSISGFVHNIGIGANELCQLHVLTPPSFIDPLTTTAANSTIANTYIRKPSVQKINFRPADVTETGFHDIGSGVVTRSYIKITGNYINKTNIIDATNFNVTGFTGVLYDQNANKILSTGFLEQAPDDFVWSVEYTGQVLDYTPDLDLYRVIGVKQSENFKFQVNALYHSPKKYAYVDKAIEPEIAPVLNFPDPPQHFFTNSVGIYGTHAKELKYSFSPPNDKSNLDGYFVFVKIGSNFNDVDDYTFDPQGVHPNPIYFKEYLPATKTSSSFLPSNNDTYYFRIYSVNKNGLSSSKSSHLAGNTTIFGINLLLDLQVQSLALISDLSSTNLPGRKDGDSIYETPDINVHWQAGFTNDVLKNFPIPNDFFWRVTYRYPDKFLWTPAPAAYILHEATGINQSIFTHQLSMEDNVGITIPGVILNEVTPFRDFDVTVEAVDRDGNSSAGGTVTYDSLGVLTSDADYSNYKGYDILYINNPPISGIRLTDRVGTVDGAFSETCDSVAASFFCTDQWLEDDGTFNLVIARDTERIVTGVFDLLQGAFLVSRTYIDPLDVQKYLDAWIVDSTQPVIKQSNKIASNVYLVLSDGITQAEDYRFSVTTPFTNITSKDSLTDDDSADILSEIYVNAAFVDTFLNKAVIVDASKKNIVKKLAWSRNCVKVGARNAFLKGSLTYRAWVIININWDSKDSLDWQGANIDSVSFGDYSGTYYVRKSWKQTAVFARKTKYRVRRIQANRKSRYFHFTEPLPTHKYELVIMRSPNAHRYVEGADISVYGEDSGVKLHVSEKTINGFRLFDVSERDWDDKSHPVKGSYFIGVLIGNVNIQVGGEFGDKNADSEWNYAQNVGTNNTYKVYTNYGEYSLR